MSKKSSKRDLKPIYIRPDFHKAFKDACVKKGYKMGFTAELLMSNWIAKQEES